MNLRKGSTEYTKKATNFNKIKNHKQFETYVKDELKKLNVNGFKVKSVEIGFYKPEKKSNLEII